MISVLNGIWCELKNVLASLIELIAGAVGSGGTATIGSLVISGATPTVVTAGKYSISLNITAGTVTPSGSSLAGALPIGSYNFSCPNPAWSLPAITFTGDVSAAYTVTWMLLPP